MARRVFLHIGTMKSATTYLQSLNQLNRESLGDAGIWWPGVAENFAAIRDFFGGAGRAPGDEGAWTHMRRAIRKFDGDVLISNELLARRDERQASRLVNALAPAEPHVIVTGRDLGRVIPSMWQTETRNRGTSTWADYLAAVYDEDRAASELGRRFWGGQHLPDIVSRWSVAASGNHVTLVTVPPPGSEPTVVGDRFMSVVAPHVGALRQPPYRNASLGAHSSELMRRINLETTDWEISHYRRALKNRLGRFILSGRSESEPKLGLTAAQLAQAEVLAKDMVRQLDDLGVRVVGELSDLIPADSLQPSEVDPDSSTEADLLSAATYALVELSRGYADLKLERDTLRSGGGRSAPASSPQADPTALRPARRSMLRKLTRLLRRTRP